MINLNACPVCGGKNLFLTRSVNHVGRYCHTFLFFIKCKMCGHSVMGYSQEEAIERWNYEEIK